MGKLIDLKDKRFGKLLVLEKHNILSDCAMWKCFCDCGNYKIIKSSSLLMGLTKSCGCIGMKNLFKPTHKSCKTKEYKSWASIKRRANNKSGDHPTYENINVCKEWADDFLNFLNDVGFAPSKSHTIDRIDNSKGYYKENCRWATPKEQNKNYSQNIMLTKNGKTLCVTDWANIYNVPRHRIYKRLDKGLNESEIFNYLESQAHF